MYKNKFKFSFDTFESNKNEISVRKQNKNNNYTEPKVENI